MFSFQPRQWKSNFNWWTPLNYFPVECKQAIPYFSKWRSKKKDVENFWDFREIPRSDSSTFLCLWLDFSSRSALRRKMKTFVENHGCALILSHTARRWRRKMNANVRIKFVSFHFLRYRYIFYQTNTFF